MIATSFDFWQAFFDPYNKQHEEAKKNLLFYDKEIIAIDQLTLIKVLDWLGEKNKVTLANWFLDYATNTANVRIIYLQKEDLESLRNICLEHNLTIGETIQIHLVERFGCGSTKEFKPAGK